ncbi:MAG: hypothetical protein HZA90_08445 [Verrucomicrobia bacterium]|nr:hypothetical protein [Verrucomicrobiota bacterium]
MTNLTTTNLALKLAPETDPKCDGFRYLVSVAPSFLWFLLVVVVIVLLWPTLKQLLSHLAWRVKSGSAVEFGSYFKLSAAYAAPEPDVKADEQFAEVRKDDGTFANCREKFYSASQWLFLVHRLSVSVQKDQLYDITLYLLPHKDKTLFGVKRVEYYFGRYWGSRIFASTDRSNAFAVSTSAYGPFVCTAKVVFQDGQEVFLHRYVDFEAGPIGKVPPDKR